MDMTLNKLQELVMDSEDWCAVVHGVTKSQTRLNDWTELYCPWNSPGQNTGVGSHSLLQGIFPTQGSNSGLLHCGQILYQLSHKRSPRTLEWVVHPFSRGSPRPRNWTEVSCIAGGFFTNWAIRETPVSQTQFQKSRISWEVANTVTSNLPNSPSRGRVLHFIATFPTGRGGGIPRWC